jgi:hypothetical protein
MWLKKLQSLLPRRHKKSQEVSQSFSVSRVPVAPPVVFLAVRLSSLHLIISYQLYFDSFGSTCRL